MDWWHFSIKKQQQSDLFRSTENSLNWMKNFLTILYSNAAGWAQNEEKKTIKKKNNGQISSIWNVKESTYPQQIP